MIAGIKRIEEFDDRMIHLIDPKDGRGIVFHYNNGWNFAKIKNEGRRRFSDDTLRFLIRIWYIPIEMSSEEFNSIYSRAGSLRPKERPLFTAFGELDPNELPSIMAIVEESSQDYINRFYKTFSPK